MISVLVHQTPAAKTCPIPVLATYAFVVFSIYGIPKNNCYRLKKKVFDFYFMTFF